MQLNLNSICLRCRNSHHYIRLSIRAWDPTGEVALELVSWWPTISHNSHRYLRQRCRLRRCHWPSRIIIGLSISSTTKRLLLRHLLPNYSLRLLHLDTVAAVATDVPFLQLLTVNSLETMRPRSPRRKSPFCPRQVREVVVSRSTTLPPPRVTLHLTDGRVLLRRPN